MSVIQLAAGASLSTTTYSKVTLFYNYGTHGMTESFWIQSGQGALKIDQIISGYMNVRMKLAVNTFKFLYARISSPTFNRLVDWSSNNGITPNQGAIQDTSTAPGTADSTALLWRGKIASGPSVRIFLHGAPSGVIDRENFIPAGIAGYSKAWLAFDAYLVAGNGIYFKTAVPVPLSGRTQITAITPLTPRGALITGAAGSTAPPAGTVVYIGGTGINMVGAKGRKIVVNPAGNLMTIGGGSPIGTYTAPVAGSAGGAYYTVAAPSFGQIQYAGIERVTEHKVGSPFGQGRGRRSNTATLRR